jgi:hypothetical protein
MTDHQYPIIEEEPVVAAEPAMVRPMTMYDTVIGYLHSNHLSTDTKRAVCRQLQTEVADENVGYIKRRLKEFAKLRKGWDGYGDAIPVSSVAINHVYKIIDACKPSDLSEWRVFPNVNGTMLLELDHAAVSIGDDAFTYWAEINGEDIGEEYVPFSVDSVVEVIKKINSYV